MHGMGLPACGNFIRGLPSEPQGVVVMMCDEAPTMVGGRSLSRLIRERSLSRQPHHGTSCTRTHARRRICVTFALMAGSSGFLRPR